MLTIFRVLASTAAAQWGIVLVLAAAHPARAQSAAAQAEAMFREGRGLLAAGRFSEACAAFELSQKLEPAISTLLNLGLCREKNGQLATAWSVFLEAERSSRDASDTATQKMHRVALDRANRIEPRVSSLRIDVPAESQLEGLEVTRDGAMIPPEMWHRAFPIDGGQYTIAARAPGSSEWTTEVTIRADHDSAAVEVPRLQPLIPVPPVNTQGDPAASESSSAITSLRTSRTPANGVGTVRTAADTPVAHVPPLRARAPALAGGAVLLYLGRRGSSIAPALTAQRGHRLEIAPTFDSAAAGFVIRGTL